MIDINKYVGQRIRFYREKNNLSQKEVGEYLNTTSQTVSRYESGVLEANYDILNNLANYFHTSINNFFPPLNYDNASPVNISTDTIQIPVLGTIKAGIPIEAQQDILEYIDIPRDWTKGNKTFYGLKISGDSMLPKYTEDDIVIFEQTSDSYLANNKDCAVMVNGYDATFKNVTINDSGITLVPLNLNNQDNYLPTFYNREQIENLPVKIVGVAVEKRTRL